MQISMQTGVLVRRFGIAEAYRMIAEAGYTAIDWGLDSAWNFEAVRTAPTLSGLSIFEKSPEEVLAHYAEEIATIRRYNLKIGQAHAPFRAFDFRRKEILDYAISIYKSCITLCHAVGCKYLVIHGISIREEDTETTPEMCNAYNRKLYESLIPTLAETDVVVCMENLFSRASGMGVPNFIDAHGSHAQETADFIDDLNRKAGKTAFALCYDTGHANLLRTDARYYLPVLGHRVACLHIHDNDQSGDYHLLPYAGTYPFPAFLATLKEIGYTGDLAFEICGQQSVKRCPAPLMEPLLRYTYAIGRYFKSQME